MNAQTITSNPMQGLATPPPPGQAYPVLIPQGTYTVAGQQTAQDAIYEIWQGNVKIIAASLATVNQGTWQATVNYQATPGATYTIKVKLRYLSNGTLYETGWDSKDITINP